MINRPVFVRRGTSDILVLSEFLFGNALDDLEKYCPSVEYVIDAGANVGYATVYILSKFPSAKILLVEPDPGNIAVARLNVANEIKSGQCLALESAVWYRRERLVLDRTGLYSKGQEWEFFVRSAERGEEDDTTGYDLAELIEMSGFPRVDLLKMDIEGAEKQVLGRNVDRWVHKVRTICVELHDGLSAGDFERFASTHAFETASNGSIHWAFRVG